MVASRPQHGGKLRGFKSYSDAAQIAVALTPTVSKVHFTSYTKEKDLTSIEKDRLLAPHLHETLRRLRVLSPTWTFLPKAVTDALVKIAEDTRASKIRTYLFFRYPALVFGMCLYSWKCVPESFLNPCWPPKHIEGLGSH